MNNEQLVSFVSKLKFKYQELRVKSQGSKGKSPKQVLDLNPFSAFVANFGEEGTFLPL
ncbi:MAG: hypothetical protein AAFQ20_12450 [Bacteroidota bacterium]